MFVWKLHVKKWKIEKELCTLMDWSVFGFGPDMRSYCTFFNWINVDRLHRECKERVSLLL